MTTVGFTYDASAAKGRVRSLAFAFNRERILDRLAVMVFIDESSGYDLNNALFDADMDLYLLQRRRSFAGRLKPFVGVYHVVQDDGWQRITPFGSDAVFSGSTKLFEYVRVQRPPTLAELQVLFDVLAIPPSSEVGASVRVLVLVDESGSMGREDIASSLTPFKMEMTEQFGDRLMWHDPLDVAWTNERWVREVVSRIGASV